MPEEIIIGSDGNGNGEVKKEEAVVPTPENVAPPTDFKIAEIWIRSGTIHLDAVDSFWEDRCRALGVMEYCKDIIKRTKTPSEHKKIIPSSHGLMNFVRGGFRKRKK